VVKLEDRSAKKVQRWSQIAREASKQCRSGLVPVILAPHPLEDFLREWEAGRKLFLSEHHGLPLRDVVRPAQDSKIQPSDVLILVGPEGGWTQAEEDKVLRHGYEAVSFGTNILRAETASLAAMAIISHFWDS
jgi:16S rRNA (uracil1498-N3)-methyltransferase